MANKYTDLNDIEAEENLISAIFTKPDRIADLRVTEKDFCRPSNAFLFHTLVEMYREGIPVDLVTVVSRLKDRQQLEEAGGIIGITAIHSKLPTAAGLPRYEEIILNYSYRRQIHHVCVEIAGEAIDGNKEINQIISEAMTAFNGITQDSNSADKGIVDAYQLMADAVDSIFSGQNLGLKTGFRDLDAKLAYGMRPGELIVLAGRPSMGKTALALNIIVNVMRQGKRSLLFSLETGVESIGTRLLQSLGGVSQSEIVNIDNDESVCGKLTKVAGWFVERRELLKINTSAYHTIDTIRSLCRKAQLQGGLDFVMIDHAQLISAVGFKNDRTKEMSYISRMLKTMAKELNIPIFLLSQLNRSVESREDKRPRLSDLRESGTIEQDADVVMLIYRDAYYHPEDNKPGCEVNVAKQKDGATGVVPLVYMKEFMRFRDVPVEESFGQVVKEKDIAL